MTWNVGEPVEEGGDVDVLCLLNSVEVSLWNVEISDDQILGLRYSY